MPAGPDEQDTTPAGSITEQVASNPSSKTESSASDHPLHDDAKSKDEKVNFLHHKANPGPAIPKDFSAKEEATKEERQARAQELNK
ncbi:MAG: hypothetical protein M1818_008236 [Claussenomyces sp. TS43310]|nr:MAG: hypothetical protein M1818_008236 [Claussenomyces sp. TS43310]